MPGTSCHPLQNIARAIEEKKKDFDSHFFSSLKIAEEMLEGKAIVKDTDMPAKMQLQAMSAASEALDLFDVVDCKSLAAHIKMDFDRRYGPGWQCVVGSNYGCFFTHKQGTFIYFCLETLYFLVFRAAAD